MMIKEERVLGYKRESNNLRRAGRGGRSLIVQVKKKKQTKQQTQSQNGILKLRCNLISHC